MLLIWISHILFISCQPFGLLIAGFGIERCWVSQTHGCGDPPEEKRSEKKRSVREVMSTEMVAVRTWFSSVFES